MKAPDTDQSLAGMARAYSERVLDSRGGVAPAMTWQRVQAEIDDALSAIDQMGWTATQPRTAKRMPIIQLENGLGAAVDLLREAEATSDPAACRVVAGQAGEHLEQVRNGALWLASAPGSDVLKLVLATVAANAPRPIAEALQRSSDELPEGVPEAARERDRATESAFRAALEWAPIAARVAGDGVLATTLANLGGCQASYIAGVMRDDYAPALSGQAQRAMTDAAAALEAAVQLQTKPSQKTPLDVAALAAEVAVRCVELRAIGIVAALNSLTHDLVEPNVQLPRRDAT